jgi:sRNA-binding regulator protein Hfq
MRTTRDSHAYHSLRTAFRCTASDGELPRGVRTRHSVISGARSTNVAYAAASVLVIAALCASQPVSAQYTQQGAKLVGTGAVGAANQGRSVALSADGNTAIVGGQGDNTNVGAAWVFVRNAGVLTQQGVKLVGTGAVGAANQGRSVALSADGNTAIVGGDRDNSFAGAAWVFTRSGGVWTQEGAKLVGTGAVGAARQGASVALSDDGNTAIVGGFRDNTNVGAAWVFTRSGGVWTQEGTKLVGTGAVGAVPPLQGISVALSADGNTAIVGGSADNANIGAAWVFTRSGGVWTQQQKVVGCCTIGPSAQGTSVAVSDDGNTAIVGGPNDNSSTGAVWVFTRSGGVWTQEGAKLVGTGNVSQHEQGQSVALSGDGNAAIVGGRGDNGSIGAAWVFTRSAGVWTQYGQKLVGTGSVGASEQGSATAISNDRRTLLVGGPLDNVSAGATWTFTLPASHDFNGDRKSDIAWREDTGTVGVWLMNGAAILQSAGLGNVPNDWSIVGQRDFNGDSKHDLLWRQDIGTVAIWLLNGVQIAQTGVLGTVPIDWSISGTADFNGDGKGDILWRNNTGEVAIWLLNGLQILQTGGLGAVPTNWVIAGTGDFNGDGMADILWRDNTTGAVAIWLLNGVQIAQTGVLGTVPIDWSISGTGDFNGDGKWDILWRDNNTGTVAIWLLDGLTVSQIGSLGAVSGWTIEETGDFNDDGRSDILWRENTAGTVAIWFLNGLQVTSAAAVANVGLEWTIQSLNAD